MNPNRSQNYSIFNRIFKHNLEPKDMNQAGIAHGQRNRQVVTTPPAKAGGFSVALQTS